MKYCRLEDIPVNEFFRPEALARWEAEMESPEWKAKTEKMWLRYRYHHRCATTAPTCLAPKLDTPDSVVLGED